MMNQQLQPNGEMRSRQILPGDAPYPAATEFSFSSY